MGQFQLVTVLNGIVAASLAAGCGGATQEQEPSSGGTQSVGGSNGGSTPKGGRSAGGSSVGGALGAGGIVVSAGGALGAGGAVVNTGGARSQGGTLGAGGTLGVGGALARGGNGAGGTVTVDPTCADGLALLTEALDPKEAADYIGVYLYSVPNGAMLYQSHGTACSGAVAAEACQRALASALTQTSGFPPIGADTLPYAPARAFSFVIVTHGERVTTIVDEAGLRTFLGPIDTPNEAALRLFLAAYSPRCASLTETADGYGTTYMTMGLGCSIMQMPAQYYVRVNRDATVFSSVTLQTTPCVGRRPQGLHTRQQQGPNALGIYFAEVAQLEAAAVVAFEVMARELESLHAPECLSLAARQARADEIRHAAQFANLARCHGLEPTAPRVEPVGERSVLEMALENATEGVVRETWGALAAAWQASQALDVNARSVLQATAADEARHAELSRDVDAWLHSLLTADERQQVQHAKRQAITVLRAELAANEPDPSVVAAAGVPNRARSLDLLTRLERELL